MTAPRRLASGSDIEHGLGGPRPTTVGWVWAARSQRGNVQGLRAGPCRPRPGGVRRGAVERVAPRDCAPVACKGAGRACAAPGRQPATRGWGGASDRAATGQRAVCGTRGLTTPLSREAAAGGDHLAARRTTPTRYHDMGNKLVTFTEEQLNDYQVRPQY